MTKAVKKQITLGDIELNVYMLPNGSYRLSKSQTLNVVGINVKALPDFLTKKSFKTLLGNKQSLPENSVTCSIKGENFTVDLIPIELSVMLWVEINNDISKSLVVACAIESIERRADAAFGINVTEEERNNRLKARSTGIASRGYWRKTVDNWIENHPQSKDTYVHQTVSNRINFSLFGLTAKEIREKLGLTAKQNIRDYLPTDLLAAIDTVERGAALFMLKFDVDPIEAMNRVCEFIPDSELSGYFDTPQPEGVRILLSASQLTQAGLHQLE